MRTAVPSRRRATATAAAPIGDAAGAPVMRAHVPARPDRSQLSAGPSHVVSQQTPSTQFTEPHSDASAQGSPSIFGIVGVGVGVAVSVAVGVLVGVEVGVEVGVDVGVLVGVEVGVSVISTGTHPQGSTSAPPPVAASCALSSTSHENPYGQDPEQIASGAVPPNVAAPTRPQGSDARANQGTTMTSRPTANPRPIRVPFTVPPVRTRRPSLPGTACARQGQTRPSDADSRELRSSRRRPYPSPPVPPAKKVSRGGPKR
jgi:hypothetical protein